MKLGDLFNKYGSDKDRHGYSQYYDPIFKFIRDKAIDLLEIGIGTMIPNVPSSMVGYSLPGYAPGGSLRAWKDYFPQGQITGIDIQPDTQFSDERITTHLANSLDKDSIDKVLGETQYDIIIDDGSHEDLHQLITLRNLWSRLKSGGFYIIEDLTPWNRIPKEFRGELASIIGQCHYYFSERQDLLVISK